MGMKDPPMPKHLRRRPPLTVNNVYDDRLLELRDAIVLNACKDFVRYVHVIKHAKSQKRRMLAMIRKDEVAEFFRSTWFNELTRGEVNGEKVMHTLELDTPSHWLTNEERKALKHAEQQKDDVSANTSPDILES